MTADWQRSSPAGHEAGYQPLVLVVSALALGIAVDRFFPLPAVAWWLAAVLLAAIWVFAWRRCWQTTGSWLLLAAVTALGGAWHHDQWHLYSRDELGFSLREEPSPVCLEGIALTSPRWSPALAPSPLRAIPKGEQCELALYVTSIRDGRSWRPASGHAQLEVDGHLLGVRAGDRVRVMALASRPAPPPNPGEFDYAAYERSRRTLCRLIAQFPDSVTLTRPGSGWSPRRWFSDVRETGNLTLRRSISPQRATLAAAILLGAREQLDPDRNEGYLVTGTIHVLSISGLHVGILAWGLLTVFRSGFFPRRVVLIAAIALTGLYAVLTDWQPPVVRATILVAAVCGGQLIGRHVLGYNTLALAGIAVLAFNPLSLFLVGTQLSFLAVGTMILCQPFLFSPPTTDPLTRLIEQTRPWPVRTGRWFLRRAWQIWLTGAMVWLVSMPLVWKQYGLISPAALLLNLLISVPIAVALYAGFGVLLMGWLVPPLGPMCGLICDGCLWAMEASIEVTRSLPGSYVWWLPPPAWWVALFYAGLAIYALFPALRPGRVGLAAALVVWAAGALWLPVAPRIASRIADEQPLVCTFVSVGHGTAVILELPDGETILYDCGKRGSPTYTARQVSGVLWSQGIDRVNAVIVSHADTDHFNGLPELFDRIAVEGVYVSPVMYEFPPASVQELRQAITARGIPTQELSVGKRLATGPQTRIEVLHPTRRGVYGSDNANSIVLLIESAGLRLLLPGDIESPGLEDLLAEEPIDCDVIMAPHHGSAGSDPTGFALWSRPEHVVVSGARDSDQRASAAAVESAYRARGAEVYHTADTGAVRVELRRSGVKVKTYRVSEQPMTKSQ